MKSYSSREKFFLWLLCAIGGVGLNSLFLWSVYSTPELLIETFRNPIALVFLVESFLLMGFLAHLLSKWNVMRIHWTWFVILSLLGSMAFALPVALLWPKRQEPP